ncbi:MAG: glutamine--fructose-6-phosphate transaminase (isomerizing) [Planctomycetaceae bacterium]
MCGIVGYVGQQPAAEILIAGLRRLEYRGYDSAGIATLAGDHDFHVAKAVGKVESLSQKVAKQPIPGWVGIGHTRWATHGPPTEANAHPHLGGSQVVALAHNGVIENYATLKESLQDEGYVFQSSTDTEVVAHLVARALKLLQNSSRQFPGDDPHAILVAAVREATSVLRGTFGLAILFRSYPGVIVAARQGSPLVLGIGKGEHFLASDASALAGRVEKIAYLADHQIAVITANHLKVIDRDQMPVEHATHTLHVENNDVQLGSFPHYMLKEIYEQPETLENALRGRLSEEDATAVFGGLNIPPQELAKVNRILLTACGTSWHSALLGEYLIEELARIPVEVEYASELRYRNPPIENGTLLFAITQSGETADTLAALREIKRKGHSSLAICNVVGSTIAQEASGGVYLHAGPEIGVASTKAYTSQCMTLALLALYFGRLRHLSFEAGLRIIAQLRQVPQLVRQSLQTHSEVQRIAEKYADCTNFLYLGRQLNFPTALEGALKLKEISYIHAEGYPAAEMKHGPIALVDEKTPSVFVMPQSGVYDKVVSNLEEIKARSGPVIAIAPEGDKRIDKLADDVIYVPRCEELVSPIINIIPLQLLAYHIALLRGCDVDKPRNLAKSVTVE